MKKLLVSIIIIFSGAILHGQAPPKMSFQAVVRNAAGNLVTNQSVGVRISLLQGSATGTVVYRETYFPKPQTNANGLLSLEIGGGTVDIGTFSAINWAAGPYYLKTETDPAGGSSFTITSTTQLLSVPFAFQARMAEGVADNTITSAKILDGTVSNADLANNAVSSAKIASGAVTGDKIAQAGATSGQALKWNGSTWVPANDIVGNDFTLPVEKTVNTPNAAFKISNVNWDSYSGAIYGHSGTTTGYGVYGSSFMTGVMGEAFGETSNNFGVMGLSHSNEGTGVYGSNDYVSGNTNGVYGSVYSTTGTGVFGDAFALTGTTYGVQGRSFSPSGTGVYGIAEASSGIGVLGKGKTYGVRGESTQGHGVYGYTTLKNGFGMYGFADNTSSTYSAGVLGETNSAGGAGVRGLAFATTGSGIGVYGITNATEGMGVHGYSYSTTGIAHGVHGYTASINGYGVYGLAPKVGVRGDATATSGTTYGLYGVSLSPEGYGVYAEAKHTSGSNVAVRGTSHSSSGYGVIGEVMSNTGNPIGIRGYVMSSSGYSGYFNGGRFHVSGRVGLGIFEPLAGLHLKGANFPESFMFIESNTGNDAGIRLYEGSADKWHIFNNSNLSGLQIYNTAGNTAIFCKQTNSYVGIGTTTPAYRLQVGNAADGSQARANAWNLLSDARFKKDFSDLKNPLELVGKIAGYYFFWNTGIDKSRQVGFSAQEVQKVLPEVVSEGEDGYLSIEYGKMAPLLVEAIKELKAENDLLRTRLTKIEEEMGKAWGSGLSAQDNQ